MEHVKEIRKDSLQILAVDSVCGLLFVAQVHLLQYFEHQALDLLVGHRAEVESGEHILVESVGMRSKNINFFAKCVIYDNDRETSGLDTGLADRKLFNNFLLAL